MDLRSLSLGLALVSLAAPLGCAALKGNTAKPAAAAEPQEEGEEDGIQGITGALRRMNAALSAKNFEEAAKHLKRAERAVKEATELTRSHPEFEDASESVVMARNRFEAAVERDRIERREAAIAQLVRRGETAIAQGAQLMTNLSQRVPAEEDVRALRALLTAIYDLKEQGREFGGDPLYEPHAKTREAELQKLKAREELAQWQIDTSLRLNESVDGARRAIQAGQKASAPAEQVTAYRAAAKAFDACSAAIAALESQAGYDEKRLVKTAFGPMTLGATKKECVERAEKLADEADKIAWQLHVSGLIAQLQEAVTKRSAAQSPSDVVALTDALVTMLGTCRAELDASARGPGHDAKKSFATPFGELTARELAKTCAKEGSELTKNRPMYIWRGSAESLREMVLASTQKATAARAASKPGERLELWIDVKARAAACKEAADKLAKQKAADDKYAVTTALGQLTVTAIAGECAKLVTAGEDEAKKARAAAELETFVKTLKADEVEVATKEGIPARIKDVEGGRVFVYEKPRAKNEPPEQRLIGFDKDGKRFDFRAAFRAKVDKVAGDIARFVLPVKNAVTGEALLAATQAAVAGLTQCENALPQIDRHPGFDPEAQFDTALGKHFAVELTKVCAKERDRLGATLGTARWQIALEKVRDRANAADASFKGLAAAKSGAEQVNVLSQAIGGATECGERLGPLANQVGADEKLEVASAFGKVTRKKLAGECASLLTRAKKEMEKAILMKRLDDFVATAKGDEKDVARREGLPTRVENIGSGRVFVYEQPGKGKKKGEMKRVAFNASGQRIEESLLRQATTGEPFLEKPPSK